MTSSPALESGFTLGPWSVEPTRNTISRDGVERHLENRLMQTLLFLAEHPGQTLSREQFFDSVWQGRVVNEEALSRAISLLRSVLEDNAQSPRFIQTIPGVGYRLIAEVVVPAKQATDSQEAEVVTDAGHGPTAGPIPRAASPERSGKRGSRANHVITAILVLVVALFLVDRFVLESGEHSAGTDAFVHQDLEPPAATPGTENSLAVLPFVNLSDDPQQEYFADGMTEDLLNMLARVPNLRVTARTSSFFFKGKDVPVAEIAEALNVEHVLEGSVRRRGDVLRVTAQLVEAQSDRQLWSETIEREAADIFVIQDEVTAAIAGALASSFRAESVEPVSRPSSLAAHEAYRTGRLLWWQRTPDEMHRAIDYFELAMENDPGFAPAYAAAASAPSSSSSSTFQSVIPLSLWSPTVSFTQLD